MSKLPVALLSVALLLLALSFVARPPAGAGDVLPPPPTPAPAALGRALFQAKGCTTCHRHDGLNVARVEVYTGVDLDLGTVMGAPDLTHYRPDPTFVRQWLRDPSAVRPGTDMPNLRLSDEEIEALLAFLQTNG
jgi:cytochrome c1